jgi:hypothetical protein
MEKYRIIFEDARYYRVQRKRKGLFQRWKNCEYYSNLEDAEKTFEQFVKMGSVDVMKESDWIKR